MLKDYPEHKFIAFDSNKKLRILLELSQFIESDKSFLESKHFIKLKKYHAYLEVDQDKFILMANKEFNKIKNSPRQFQIYITLLERLVGYSSKDYQFLMQTGDKQEQINKIPLSLLLDGVRSTHNIGAIIRSAECFGVQKLYIHRPYADFDESIFFKTAMGCEKNIDIIFYDKAFDIVQKLKREGFKITILDTLKDSINYKDMQIAKDNLLILGHEQLGVSMDLIELADQTINIPLGGQKNSLNVSNSCAIVLSEIFQKLI